ncbi:MAG: PqqD family protein [Caldilineales bacterium]
MLNSKQIHPIRATSVAYQVYGTEAVIINPAEGRVRMLNPTATRIWELANGERSVDDIIAVLTEEFEVTFDHAHRSVYQLLAELSKKGLIVWQEV